MCVNFTPPTRQQLELHFGATAPAEDWKQETWQDYTAPIIVAGDEGWQALLASYGMIPKRKLPEEAKRFSTMNARAETVGKLPSYRNAWRQGALCLVPMQAFYEPCYESGKAVRWRIGMADNKPFAVAGLWRSWKEMDGSLSNSFTQLTINADAHPLMSRMHKPDAEKRTLVIVSADEYDAWLTCRDPELARSFLRLYPAELLQAEPAPIAR
ncbi:SOS response-associated peptidase family protein [Chromobacterium phragmitis]|uniref:SOS response-associated peptidase n=1 Tax=Chromobacterium amazonense TaxID=1382803 RepID=UPI0021B7A4FF|nr:SOS response-associated peptidase [Chromobacterium amazonense]MBM2886457.1 SOS response-associated peptidase family protein [Chromobacterium amazonense]